MITDNTTSLPQARQFASEVDSIARQLLNLATRLINYQDTRHVATTLGRAYLVAAEALASARQVVAEHEAARDRYLADLGPVCERPESVVALDDRGDCIDCGHSPAVHQF